MNTEEKKSESARNVHSPEIKQLKTWHEWCEQHNCKQDNDKQYQKYEKYLFAETDGQIDFFGGGDKGPY